jgi:hypothetical protein
MRGSCRDALLFLARKGELPIIPSRVRTWWHKGEEIDIVAIDDTGEKPKLLLVEAKWSKVSSSEARRILDRLRAKASLLPVDKAEFTYVIAVRSVEDNLELLGDEMLITVDTIDSISREAC